MQGKIFQSIKNNYDQIVCNYPIYKIKDLFVGEIVLLDNHSFKRIKKFAIFKRRHNGSFVHIKSNKTFKPIEEAVEGDYAINEIMNFIYMFIISIKKTNQKPKSAVSKQFIIELENRINSRLASHLTIDDLFGL